MRIVSKGSMLPFVHESVGWDEYINFKDYDIVFVNLRSLEKHSQDYDHPYNESEDSPVLFAKSDIRTFLEENGHMVVYLPQSLTVDMGNETTQPKTSGSAPVFAQSSTEQQKETDPYREYNLLDWLPFDVVDKTEEDGSSVEVFDKNWEWYFGNSFSWNKMLNFKSKIGYERKDIAGNSYGEIISPRLVRESEGFSGSLSLLPSKNNITYSDFVRGALHEVFEVEVSVEGHAPPGWLSEYSLPHEDSIESSIQQKKGEIEELEEDLESLTKFKKLLYETNTNLEEVTKDALRELGFMVDGEVPGKRDGILHTTELNFVLEITGTTGGIKKSKSRQLDDWVENVVAENPDKEVSGLLIVNSEMGTPPDERDVSIEPNVKRYMERRGDYKVLTTVDLYRLVRLNLKQDVRTEDIEAIFYQDDTLLSLPDELSG